MTATVARVTPALLRLLRSRHDDGARPLRVTRRHLWGAAERLEITRGDGTELSDAEAAHVRAALAALADQ